MSKCIPVTNISINRPKSPSSLMPSTALLSVPIIFIMKGPIIIPENIYPSIGGIPILTKARPQAKELPNIWKILRIALIFHLSKKYVTKINYLL